MKILLRSFNEEIKEYYAAIPKSYPNVTLDGTVDNWEPHYAIIGEIVDTKGEM